MKDKRKRNVGIILSLLFLLAVSYVLAEPTKPSVSAIRNSTKADTNGTKVNGSGSDATSPYKAGGFIFTIELTSVQQNDRWKAYVGNVSGLLTLEDSDGYAIYDWQNTLSISGQVYATRTSGAVNWTNINCSYNNATHWEEMAINHTSNPNDNISVTFNDTDNSEFYVGTLLINATTCDTINLHVNGSASLTDDWEEILLYDGGPGVNATSNSNFKNIVYATIMQDDQNSYHTNHTYDFQMIIPEVGITGWASSTPYYFFVELT